MLGTQFAESGAPESWESAVLREQFVGQLQSIIAPGARAQDDREQLGNRKRLRAEVLQAFAWALVGGQLAYGCVIIQLGVFVGVGVGFARKHVRFSSFTASLV